MKAPLVTSQLSIGYKTGKQTRLVASDLNLTLRRGQLICLLGQNGVGKSTLMRTLAGMQPALAGEVRLDDVPVHAIPARELAQQLAIVTTDRVEVGMMTGRMLIELGRHPHTDWTGQLTPDDERVVNQILSQVHAEDLAERRLSEMSDGERQRVLIGRALAQQGNVLLLDEPTAYLDLPRRYEIVQLLRRLARDTGQAILMSTHDLDLALKAADRLWVMDANGHIEDGVPEDLVLSGHLQRAFDSDGVTFDMMTGSYTLQTPVIGQVQLIGQGIHAEWTRRALRRSGYAVGNSGLLITIEDDGWWVGDVCYKTIGEILGLLRDNIVGA